MMFPKQKREHHLGPMVAAAARSNATMPQLTTRKACMSQEADLCLDTAFVGRWALPVATASQDANVPN